MTILRRHRLSGGRARARFALVVPAVVAAMVLSACSGASSVDQTSQPGGETTAAENTAGNTGGETTGSEPSGETKTLTIDNSFVLTTMDPSRSLTPTFSIITRAVYNTLLTQDDLTGSPEPMLAASYEANADATEYTFTLRDDVVFSDGAKFTSADVLFSFQRLASLQLGGSYLMDGLTVTAPDETTVVIASETPRPAIPAMMSTPSFVVMNSAAVKAAGGVDTEDAPEADKAETWFNTTSAGSGPYVLESYATDDQVILSRNANYWGEAPEFDRIVIRNMPAATQLLNVERGVNEIAMDLSAAQSAGLENVPAVTVRTDPSSAVFRVQLNMNPEASATASNPKIQEAVRYGLNYPVIQQLAGAGAVRASGVIPNTMPGSIPAEEAPVQDIERAKQAIADSGIENPTLKLTYPSELNVNGLDFATISQQVQADMAVIGITVELEALPVTPFLTEWRKGMTEMTAVYNLPDYLDPSYYTSFVPGGGGSDAGRAGWAESDDTELVELGKKINTTADDATRFDLSQQLMRKFNEESPYMPLMQPAQTVVSSSNLTNVFVHPIWNLDVLAIGTN